MIFNVTDYQTCIHKLFYSRIVINTHYYCTLSRKNTFKNVNDYGLFTNWSVNDFHIFSKLTKKQVLSFKMVVVLS